MEWAVLESIYIAVWVLIHHQDRYVYVTLLIYKYTKKKGVLPLYNAESGLGTIGSVLNWLPAFCDKPDSVLEEL